MNAAVLTLAPEAMPPTRFNAVRHGLLSRYVVLPWGSEAEYAALLRELGEEHRPVGPTEAHLVEELAGIFWRKRRLRIAEAAIFRKELHHGVSRYGREDEIAGAALMPVTGQAKNLANIPAALACTRPAA